LLWQSSSVLWLPIFQTCLAEQEGPTEGMDVDLELFSTKELAYHITLFDWDLFWCVHEVKSEYE
jgi:Rap guanine nucleotide exchange factor 4